MLWPTLREPDPRGVHRAGGRVAVAVLGGGDDVVRARDEDDAGLGDPALELGELDGEDDLRAGDGEDVEPGV
jgi:hypothetical protein